MTRVVVTGGAGFLGSLVAEQLLNDGTFRGQEITSLVLTDRVAPQPSTATEDDRVEVVTGELSASVPALFAQPVNAVLHLASAVSSEVEADPGLGMVSTIDATRALLAASAAQSTTEAPVTLLFSSSLAVYGSDPAWALPETVDERTLPLPQSSYGVQKLACEFLIYDATRRGDVDGRVARLMTVAVRPGKPNAAASGFLSSIIREPLAGLPAICTVDPQLEVALASPASTVRGLLAVAAAPRGRGLGCLTGGLPVNLPALTTKVVDLLDALATVGGPHARELVDVRPDPSIEAIVGSWPARFANDRASSLGLAGDASATDLVRAYSREHVRRP